MTADLESWCVSKHVSKASGLVTRQRSGNVSLLGVQLDHSSRIHAYIKYPPGLLTALVDAVMKLRFGFRH